MSTPETDDRISAKWTAVEIDVEYATIKMLRREAAARDLSVRALATRLLETIAAEQLTKAILDD